MALYEIRNSQGETVQVEAPEGTARADLLALANKQYYLDIARERIAARKANEDSGFFRQALDLPVGLAQGAVTGTRLLTEAFGANNAPARGLRQVEELLGNLKSATAKRDAQEVARIMQEAEDKGIGEQFLAAAKSFGINPLDTLANALGTAAPIIAGSIATGPAAAGAVGLGLGATMGAGTVKGAIFDAVKEQMLQLGVSEEAAQRAAEEAQSYGGENLDQIILGTILGGVAGRTGIEPAAARVAAGQIADKVRKLVPAIATGAVKEGPLEGLQGGQEQLAQNIALQREGFDTPAMRGVAGAAGLEALAGTGLGAGMGAIEQRGEVAKKRADDAAKAKAAQEEQARRAAALAGAESLDIQEDAAPEVTLDTILDDFPPSGIRARVAAERLAKQNTEMRAAQLAEEEGGEQEAQHNTPDVKVGPPRPEQDADQQREAQMLAMQRDLEETELVAARLQAEAQTEEDVAAAQVVRDRANRLREAMKNQTARQGELLPITPSQQRRNAEAQKAREEDAAFGEPEASAAAPYGAPGSQLDMLIEDDLTPPSRAAAEAEQRRQSQRWPDIGQIESRAQQAAVTAEEARKRDAIATGTAPQYEMDLQPKRPTKAQPDMSPAERETIAGIAAAQPAEAQVLQPQELEALGIPRKVPVHRRVVGKDLSMPEVRQQVQQDLQNYAQLPTTPPEVASRVNNFLQGPVFQAATAAPAGVQGEMFNDRGQVRGPTTRFPGVQTPAAPKVATPAAPVAPAAPKTKKPKAKPPAPVETTVAEPVAEVEPTPAAEAADPVVAKLQEMLAAQEERLAELEAARAPKKEAAEAASTAEAAPAAEPEPAEAPKPKKAQKAKKEAPRKLTPKEVAERITKARKPKATEPAPVDTDEDADTAPVATKKNAVPDEAEPEVEVVDVPGGQIFLSSAYLDAAATVFSEDWETKRAQSRDAAADIEAFLKKGGKIKTLPPSLKKLISDISEFALALKLAPSTIEKLGDGDLAGALDDLTTIENKQVAKLAKALRASLGDTKVELWNRIRDPGTGQYVEGAYAPQNDTIYLSLDSGMNVTTLLHEVTHALTSQALRDKANPVVKQLQVLYDKISPFADGMYGATTLDEFVAEAFSNMKFRQFLQGFTPKGDKIGAWKQFLNTVSNFVRRLMGMQTEPLFRTANSEIDNLVELILAPAPEYRNAGVLFKVADGVRTPAAASSAVIDRLAKATTDNPATQTQIKAAAAWINGTTGGVKDTARELVMGLMPLKALADSFDNVPAVRKMFDLMENIAGQNIAYEKRINSTIDRVKQLLGKDRERRALLDKVIAKSTVEEVDPSIPLPTDENGRVDDEKQKVWDALQKDWKALGKDGQAAYTELRDAYNALYDELLTSLEGRIDSLVPDDADVENENPASGTERRKSIREKVLGRIIRRGRIRPYFPLYRRGDYWIAYYAENEDGVREDYYAAFESPGQRDRAVEFLRAQGIEPKIQVSFESMLAARDIPTTSTLHTLLQAVTGMKVPKVVTDKTTGVPQLELDANGEPVMVAVAGPARDKLVQEFLDAMPESSILRSFQKREGYQGFEADAIDVFKQRAPAYANQIVRMRNDSQIEGMRETFVREMNEAVAEKGADPAAMAALARSMAVYIERAKNPAIATWARRLKGAAFAWTLGANVSSVLVNTTNLAVVVYPYLAGKYGAVEAFKMVGTAYKLFTDSGRDRTVETLVPAGFDDKGRPKRDKEGNIIYKTINHKGWWSLENYNFDDATLSPEVLELKELVDVAIRRGQISRSITGDILDIDNPDATGLEKVNAISGLMFHHGERANRQISMTAAYKLELDRMRKEGRTIDEAARKEAAELALDITEDTNSGALQGTAPKYAQSNLGSVVFMYKRFGISMLYLQIRTAKEALSRLPSEERTVARRQLAGIFATSATMAGVQGVPFYGAVSFIWNTLFLDDDEEDFDMMASRVLGQTFYDGLLNEAFGIDVSGRIGMSNLIFRTQPNSNQESLMMYGLELFGGPVVGVAQRIGEGAEYIFDGEFQRGFERFLPAGLSNGLKSLRYYTEGANTLRGDPIVEDIHPWNVAAQALGFAPTDYSRRLEVNAINKRIERSIGAEQTRLMRNYYLALRNNDADGVAEAMEKIQEFNERAPAEAMITPKTLKKSLAQHQRTSVEAGRFGGVTIQRRFQREAFERMQAYEEGWD